METLRDKLAREMAHQAPPAPPGMHVLDALALGLSPVPGVGDVAGLAADARRFIQEPESRTLTNYGLAALGLLPFVPPALAGAHKVLETANKGTELSQLARARPRERGIFGGPRAKTANLQALSDAIEMADKGVTGDKIWKETGWWIRAPGTPDPPGGVPRFEIDDSRAQFKQVEADREARVKYGTRLQALRELLNRPDIMEKRGITRDDIRKELRAAERGMERHGLSNVEDMLKKGVDYIHGNAPEVLSHDELYAAYPEIAQRTKIGRGLEKDMGGARGRYWDEPSLVELRSTMMPREALSTALHEFQHNVQAIEDLPRGVDAETMGRLIDDPSLSPARTRPHLEKFQEYLDSVGLEHTENPSRQDSRAFEAYRHTAGEAEARAVQSRQGLTPEQRREIPPWQSYDVDPSLLIPLKHRGGKMYSASYEPKKTQTAYKMFRAKDGKLYPLFVKGNEPVTMREWLRAESGELTPAGKVKSTLGPLAYRPGWHAGDAPVATHIGAGRPPAHRRPDQVWAEIEMAADKDWQKVANERMEYTKAGKPKLATAHITDQVPYGGFYRYKTNPNMLGEWLIGGDMRVNRVLTDEEVAELGRKILGVTDLPRIEPLDLTKLGF